MSSEVNRKKRGRKSRDDVDVGIRESRNQIPRALRHLDGFAQLGETLSERSYSVDELVRACLDRELEIMKDHELVEMREVPVDDEGNSLGGSPVSVRLALPVLSVAKCLAQADAQIRLWSTEVPPTDHTCTFFTPEAHILLSKACEQLTIELAVRSFLQGAVTGTSSLVTSQHLKDGIAAAWRTRGPEYAAFQSLHFLNDVTDRFCDEDLLDDLDNVAKIHRTR